MADKKMAEDVKKEQLLKFREQIDQLDQQLIRTLAQRQEVVREVFSKKLSDSSLIRDADREEALLKKVREMAINAGVDPYFAEQLFRDIIYQSVRFQSHSLLDHQNNKLDVRSISVSYQGTRGAYSHQAAMRHFSERYDDIRCIGFKTFHQAAAAVEEGETDVAILPIENTTAGSINDTYDVLAEKELHIIGEEVLKVNHCLMTTRPVEISDVKRIISHPQAISQCSRFLAELTHCRVDPYTDTAMAAKKVKEDADPAQAAIASSYAAELYELYIIAKDMANQPGNYTRFVIVSRDPIVCDPQIPAKTSLLLATVHEKGALLKCLKVLEKHGINMTKLESRPRLGKPWQYLFYVDLEGNREESNMRAALKKIEDKAAHFKILGCYPAQQAGN
ncbi:prephenate dehydratase [Balneolales bacterium ANBcel1]|nr:prephenate dehydratase [Balneolales bacterium ANBcel1]